MTVHSGLVSSVGDVTNIVQVSCVFDHGVGQVWWGFLHPEPSPHWALRGITESPVEN